MSLLRFESHQYLRQRLILATLSGRPVRIDNIRAQEDNPGLRGYNGSVIEISYTGTTVVYRPGIIVGGRVQHDCGTERGIGYYLEMLIALAPFTKQPFHVTLTGITSDNVDILRTVTLINKRGAPPLGGGEVTFHCPNIKRVRDANRMVDVARNILGEYVPDVYVYTDHYKGQESGRSPGFALALVAESTTGALLSAELAAEAGQTPEELGERAAYMLLQEIHRGGCFDVAHQWIAYCGCIQFLRDIKQAFGTVFKIVEDKQTDTLLLSCMGTGYTNVNKKTT
ncbi:RNA 3'-terminal phosphate cyclase/enolpyruvate transferase [Syncephalis plumigaleata]|nr:RNA 3'-terminal phosphate cyclase/enolpyruvate transferase [Syncephalis plumigaleata]